MEWISVNHKLPEKETDVLCFRFLGMPMAVCAQFDGKWESYLDGGYCEVTHITHWMPLPKSPNIE